jgi:hypothetical protein
MLLWVGRRPSFIQSAVAKSQSGEPMMRAVLSAETVAGQLRLPRLMSAPLTGVPQLEATTTKPLRRRQTGRDDSGHWLRKLIMSKHQKGRCIREPSLSSMHNFLRIVAKRPSSTAVPKQGNQSSRNIGHGPLGLAVFIQCGKPEKPITICTVEDYWNETHNRKSSIPASGSPVVPIDGGFEEASC